MNKKVVKTLGILAPFVAAGSAFAFTAPGSDSFAYDIYDIVVKKLLKGPAGFVGGVGAIVYGAASLIMGRILPAVLGVIGGALLLKADTITQSLGLTF